MEKQAVTELIAMLDYASARSAEINSAVSQLEAGRVSNYIINMQAHEVKITDAKQTLETWQTYVNRLRSIIEERIKETTGVIGQPASL